MTKKPKKNSAYDHFKAEQMIEKKYQEAVKACEVKMKEIAAYLEKLIPTLKGKDSLGFLSGGAEEIRRHLDDLEGLWSDVVMLDHEHPNEFIIRMYHEISEDEKKQWE